MSRTRWMAGAGALLISLALAACAPTTPVEGGATPEAGQPATEEPVTEQPATEPPAAETPATAQPAAEPTTVMRPTPEPAAAGTPPAKPGAGIAEADLPVAALNMRQMLAQQVGIDPTEIVVLEAEAVDWPDSCLGAGGPEEMCAAMITPGFRIVLEAKGGRYVYHTDAEGNQSRLVEAPESNVGDLIVEFTSTAETGLCRKTLVGAEGIAYGGCYTELRMGGRFVMEQRAIDLETFRSTFAPFTATTPAGDVVFNGAGAQEATPAEQRMIGEWMAIVTAEAVSGSTSAGLGLVLAHYQEGGNAALCRNVSVYASGIAYVADCKAEPPLTLPVVRLDGAQVEALFGWVDAFQSVEDTRVDGSADVMTTTVFFAGRGETAPDEAAISAMEALAGDLAAAASAAAAVRIGSCPEAGEGQALYRNDAQGYCVLYPTTHEPVETAENSTSFVLGGDLMQHSEPRMEIHVMETDQSAAEAAEAMMADVSQAMSPDELPRTTVAFGPVGAVVLDQLPGQDLRRMIFAAHNGKLYTISFTPADGAIDALYMLAVDSLSFTE